MACLIIARKKRKGSTLVDMSTLLVS